VNEITTISANGRQAAVVRDWGRVGACGLEIRRRAPHDAEGPFLLGLAQKAARKPTIAAQYFSQALELSADRYDAAIELAFLYVLLNRHAEANELLDRHQELLANSPKYLDLAGQTYSRMGMYDEAWPLYERANQLQPDVEVLQANMAACAVYLGKISEASAIYTRLLTKHPAHQRNHYELAQLERATNDNHVKQMLAALKKADPKPAKNIFLYYALAKEFEDLGRWDEAFDYYQRGGDAVRTTMVYDVATDTAVIDKIIEVCTSGWLAKDPVCDESARTPIFVVGLPRTGTTLTDRILSCHSRVASIGETQFLHMVLRRNSGLQTDGELTADVVEAARQLSAGEIAQGYMDAASHRLGDAPFFIDKLPENVLHLGFIAKAWPRARIIHLRRNPMDACFAMYKQSFFRFAYSLDDLAEYYLAYDRLSRHWRNVLVGRMIEVEYEQLVSDQERQTRRLLEALGLPFEEACLHFEQNTAPIATASSVQVREKVHTRSVNKWKKFERQLGPLRERLEAGGVKI